MSQIRLGIDVGGTFTDVAAVEEDTGAIWHHKERSTPDDPARAILSGTAQVLALAGRTGVDVAFFGHGTTVITNMILERKGTRLAMVTTRGFRDVLDLGRQARPHVYDYRVGRPAPLAARRDRYEIAERIAADGQVVTPLDEDALASLARKLAEEGYPAVAVCFLHGYLAPEHEQRAAALLRAALPQAFVTASHEVAPEYREFERFATTALNGFVGSRAGRYFAALEEGLRGLGIAAPLYTVTSNAGLVDMETVKAVPVRTALSGPAAGVRGIGRVLARHRLGDLVTFDVGGTSTDVAILPDGAAGTARAREVDGHPVLAPMVDIEVIGSGGGSIARLDPGGAVLVGPESAGADPGPAAYGHGGTAATVTDAALVLGRIGAGAGLTSDMRLDRAAAEAAVLQAVGDPLGLSAPDAAQGILAISTAGMARTIRTAALTRGLEPERLCLVAYGGAGPLLGAEVAMALGIARMIVPMAPGTLCARAILVSDLARDYSLTRLTPLEGAADLTAAFHALREEGEAWLGQEGVPKPEQAFDCAVECRYAGQSFEIAVPVADPSHPAGLRVAFDHRHAQTQGFSLPDRPVEAVTFRVRARSCRPALKMAATAPATGRSPGRRQVYFDGADWETAVWHRSALAPGARIEGPCIVEEDTSTTVIPPGWACHVLDDGTMSLTHGGG